MNWQKKHELVEEVAHELRGKECFEKFLITARSEKEF